MTYQEILQILGGIGVISSILFTGLQIRRNTRALRAAAYQTVSKTFADMWLDLARNAEMTDLMLRGGDDFDSLSRIEKARVRFSVMAYVRIYENAYFQHEIGILKDQDWDAIVGDMIKFFDRPSAPAVWRLVSDRNGVEFRRFVERLIAERLPEAAAT